jgi:hypothetical protein
MSKVKRRSTGSFNPGLLEVTDLCVRGCPAVYPPLKRRDSRQGWLRLPLGWHVVLSLRGRSRRWIMGLANALPTISTFRS